MADSEWIEQKEEYLGSQTKSNQPRRNDKDMKRTVQETLGKSPKDPNEIITKIINSQ